MTGFNPIFIITNRMTSAITWIERARGFLDAARLSDDWVRDMGTQALIKEAHHTTHIEGTRLNAYCSRSRSGKLSVDSELCGRFIHGRGYVYTPSAVEVPVMMAERITWLNSGSSENRVPGIKKSLYRP
jgi:hypothetical protein